MSESDEVITPAQLAKEMSVTTGYLAQLRYLGDGPAFLKLSTKAVRYRRADIEAWKASVVRTRTDQRSAPAGAVPASRAHCPGVKSAGASRGAQQGDGDAA